MKCSAYYLLHEENNQNRLFTGSLNLKEFKPIQFGEHKTIQFISGANVNDSDYYEAQFNEDFEVKVFRFFKSSPFCCTVLCVSSETIDLVDHGRKDFFSVGNKVKGMLGLKGVHSKVSAYSLYAQSESVSDETLQSDISMQLRNTDSLDFSDVYDAKYYQFLSDNFGFALIDKSNDYNYENYCRLQMLQSLLIGFQTRLRQTRFEISTLLDIYEPDRRMLKSNDLLRDFLEFNGRYYLSSNPVPADSTMLFNCWQLMASKENLNQAHDELIQNLVGMRSFIDVEWQKVQSKHQQSLNTRLTVIGVVIAVAAFGVDLIQWIF